MSLDWLNESNVAKTRDIFRGKLFEIHLLFTSCAWNRMKYTKMENRDERSVGANIRNGTKDIRSSVQSMENECII